MGVIRTLSFELREFYSRWIEKSNAYQVQDLHDCFDKFFTLFVVYNRLYMEAAWFLARKGKIRLPPTGRTSYRLYISDSFAAKECVRRFLGASETWLAIQNDNNCRAAVRTIDDLIDRYIFAIKLDARGEPRRPDDLRLLAELRSNVPSRSVTAILDIIYSIRCNMFHGHKGYNTIQSQLLVPVAILLEKLVTALYERLNRQEEQGALDGEMD